MSLISPWYLALFFLFGPISQGYKVFDYCDGTSWIKFGGNCYLFQETSRKRVSYYDAEDFCRTQGAHLASIHSEAENNFILDTLEQGGFGGRLWIGLNILAGNDTLQWSDGSVVNFTRKVPKEFYVNEKCFIMMRSQKGWRPEHCALNYAPICKRPEGVIPTSIPPIKPPVTPNGNCPESWLQFGRKCYKFFGSDEADRQQYKQARDACWALGKDHDLVAIHSMEEQAFLSQHLGSLGRSAWIGMRQVTSDEIGHDLVFGWIDNSRTDFKYWTTGHPPPGTWKYCARLSYEGVSKGQWVADYCEIEKYGYICQRPSDPNLPVQIRKPSKCKAGFEEFDESCYRLVSTPESQRDAERSCQNLGGHLVSILDGFEQAFLYNFIGRNLSAVWNGLSTKQGTRYLSWTDGQPVYYSNWAEGRPTLRAKDNSCVLMDVSNNLKWNVTDCSAKLPFVCEIEDGKAPDFKEVIGNCSDSENSWIDVGDDFCYHVPEHPQHILSWDTTSRYCLTKGMKMVRSYSNHQMNSLAAYLWQESYGVHIGLTRSFDKQSFVWVDGSDFKYTNWDSREPSNYPGEKDCVAFDQSTGKWRTVSCSGGGVAMCQLAKITKKHN